MMTPSVGRIVHYTLTEADATHINWRRQASGHDEHDPACRIRPVKGNEAEAGQVYPMVIVRVWDDGPDAAVNGRVLLDGTDDLWATSRHQGEGEGQWREPPRAGAQQAPARVVGEGEDTPGAEPIPEAEAVTPAPRRARR